MKRIYLLFIFLLLPILATAQADITLQWDHDGVDTDGFEILRYQVIRNTDGTYQAPAGDPVETYDASGGGIRTYDIPSVPAGAWAFAARAYAIGDPPSLTQYSGLSNYANCYIPTKPSVPTNSAISGAMMTVMFSLPENRNATVTLALEKVPQLE